MTLTCDTQIKTLYEVEGCSPEEISEITNFQVGAIKAKLMTISSKYRKDCGHEEEGKNELNFTDEEVDEINKHILHLAKHAESEKVQADMCKYIRDDKKGRKDVVRGVRDSGGFNMVVFNKMLQGAKEQMNKVYDSATMKMIESK